MRRPGELIDEHPATAESLVRRGFAVRYVPKHRAVGPSEVKRQPKAGASDDAPAAAGKKTKTTKPKKRKAQK